MMYQKGEVVMSEQLQSILDLINRDKSLNEIIKKTGLSNQELSKELSILRNSGYTIDRQYYYNGKIKYLINPSIKNLNSNDNEMEIQIPKNTKNIKFMLTADNHIGSTKQSMEANDKMLEYCVKKNIHIIINVGDFFHGIYPTEKSMNQLTKYKSALEQIAYGLKAYPYDKSVYTITILGNHDASFLIEEGIDIKSIILERRQDIIPLGYGFGIIKMNQAQIYLQHPIERLNIMPKIVPYNLILAGHSHNFRIKPTLNGSGMKVQAGTMSYVPTNANEKPIPNMTVVELKITQSGIIEYEKFEHFVFINEEFVKISELLYDIKITGTKSTANEFGKVYQKLYQKKDNSTLINEENKTRKRSKKR